MAKWEVDTLSYIDSFDPHINYTRVGDHLVTVHRHIHFPNTWVLHCGYFDLDMVNLYTNDLTLAKSRAIDIVGKQILNRVKKWSNLYQEIYE